MDEGKNRTLVEMAMMMLDEHRTHRKFLAEAISTACYISNRILLRSILNLTSYELPFGRKLKVLHLRVFGYRCFILKRDNLDKFESYSSKGIFLRYSLYGHSYRVLNIDTNTIMESCDVTFNEPTPYANSFFECADDQEMSKSIFVDDNFSALGENEDGSLLPSTTPTSSTPAEYPVASTSTSATLELAPAQVEGEFTSRREAPQHIQRRYPPHMMIEDLDERITRSKTASHAHFTDSAFVASFEPHNVRHAYLI